jgi:hypothetical protein
MTFMGFSFQSADTDARHAMEHAHDAAMGLDGVFGWT